MKLKGAWNNLQRFAADICADTSVFVCTKARSKRSGDRRKSYDMADVATGQLTGKESHNAGATAVFKYSRKTKHALRGKCRAEQGVVCDKRLSSLISTVLRAGIRCAGRLRSKLGFDRISAWT